MKKKVELLAPAGSMEAFHMALANGADAVYMGGKEFSARSSAENFSLEGLEEAVDFAHIRGKKVYIALNILIGQSEIDKALKYTNYLWEIGVDGLIVQDLGLALLLRKNFPDLELHASTQMSVVDYGSAKYLESLGFSRVVVGREIAKDQVEKIRDQSNLEIEAFCHGALCVCVSGQCLMSSMIGGRSGNRGACAQPCRKEYLLKDLDDKKAYPGGYVISPRDLNTIDGVEELYSWGVFSFKLEGRMKRPEYVATLTHNYARALKDLSYDQDSIKEAFNRTFTKGLSFEDFGRDYISFDRPDNRGLKVGQVLETLGKKAIVEAAKDLSKGDLLEISDVLGHNRTYKLDVDIKKGTNQPLDLPFSVKKKSLINRVLSQKLKDQSQKSLESLYSQEPLHGFIEIKVGQKPVFSLEGEHRVSVQGLEPVEEARNKGLDKDRIRQSLSKFDRSFFFLQSLDFQVEERAFLPIKTLNALRRQALEVYEDKYRFKRTPIANLSSQVLWDQKPDKKEKEKISVEVSSYPLLSRIDLSLIDRIELNFEDQLEEAIDYIGTRDIELFIHLPFFPMTEEFEALIARKISSINGFVIQNLGHMEYEKFGKSLVAGQSLNIYNLYTAGFFRKKSMDFIPSLELNYRQLEEFTQSFGTCGQVYIYGHQKVMEMKHCPMSLKKNCGSQRNCKTCNYRTGYKMEDNRGAEFPFIRSFDSSQLYNSVPTYLGQDMDEIRKLRPSIYKIKFILEEEPIEEILEGFYSYFQGHRAKLDSLNAYVKKQGFTRGHLRKGIIF